MKRSGRTHPPTRIPTTLSRSSRTKPPIAYSDPPPAERGSRPLRGCLRNTPFPGRRPGWGGGGADGRRSGPTTPLLKWKFDDVDLSQKPAARSGKARRKLKGTVEGAGVPAAARRVSARKLAAGIWQMQAPAFSVPMKSILATPFRGHLQSPYVCNPKSMALRKVPKDELQSPVPGNNLSNGILPKLEHSVALPSNSVMERATKWDLGSSLKASDEVFRFFGHLKILEDQQVTTVSVVSALQAELELARAQVNELEVERQLSKKKLDHFLKKLAEEKASWQKREHEKVHAIIDDLKDDLNRERKNVRCMEIVNSKLVNELTETKLAAKRHLQDYEKEWKTRELMEEVCDELAKEIGEDKAEVEALKGESMKIRQEVEEERKMLQMAEVWREERVQMKLIDAKLALENKYSELSKLQSYVEAFLHENSSSKSGVADIKEPELLRDAVNSVKVQEMKEFVYQPPPHSEDLFSVFEELHPGDEPNERDIELCYESSPASRASKVRTVSPEMNGISESPVKYANKIIDRNRGIEDDSDWETLSHIEEHGSCNSPEGSDPSVNGFCESNASVSGTDWERNAENGKANSEISEVCSATTRQSRKKTSTIARLWRVSCPNNGEDCRIFSADVTNGRVSNGRMSNGNLSSDAGFGEADLSPHSAGQWSSPDSVNHHITQGMKGCIEWPRGTQKHNLKAKLLDTRIESQKIQLRHVLKQKL